MIENVTNDSQEEVGARLARHTNLYNVHAKDEQRRPWQDVTVLDLRHREPNLKFQRVEGEYSVLWNKKKILAALTDGFR